MLSLQHDNSAIKISSGSIAQWIPQARPAASAAIPTLGSLLQKLNLQLQTSLELDKLLGLFFGEVRQLIALGALVYHHNETDFHLQLGELEPFAINYQLSHQEETLGELSLYSRAPLAEGARQQLEKAFGCLLFPLRNALLYRRAIQASLRDPLTGTGNRVALEQTLGREIEMSRRYARPLSLIMLDMDHFKTLNDTHGHHAGDAALRAVAKLLREQLRNTDLAFRFGGEEFVLLLPNSDIEAARIVGERIRRGIEGLTLEVGNHSVPLSASLGCSTYRSSDSQESLLHRADNALYQAKRNGRNRLFLEAA